MATTRGPLLGLGAHGAVGGAMIFSNWKGRSTVKFSPSVTNPNTPSQVSRRAMLRFLGRNFGTLSAAEIATYSTLALNGEISTYNAWVAYNMDRWNNFLWPSKAYPATEATDSAPMSFVATTALKRSVKVTVVWPTPFNNWGLIIHRSTSSGFTPSLANAIRVLLWESPMSSTINWTDGPLSPDTYYYRLAMFSDTGNEAFPNLTQYEATLP